MKNIIYLFAGLFLFSACEDVIEVDLKEGDNQFVVDAWINNLEQTQSITLSRVTPYFEASNPPVDRLSCDPDLYRPGRACRRRRKIS